MADKTKTVGMLIAERYFFNDEDVAILAKDIDAAIVNEINKENKACTELAWKMQMEQFGGGTAIGNEIQNRRKT